MLNSFKHKNIKANEVISIVRILIGGDEKIENKLGLSCAKLSKLGARNQLAWADNSAIMAEASSLAKLQLRIYWHNK